MSEAVAVQALEYTYLANTPLQGVALRGVSLHVKMGSITALIGPNGAGKSTLVQFLNGLLRPIESGQVVVLGHDTHTIVDPGHLRREVGLVFQQAHQQLFEQFVGDDIAYGPRQLGLTKAQVRERVYSAMEWVGLSPTSFVDRQTFTLSGGEMRRVALAGVLAMEPRLLVLDEATTGLDPRGRSQIHALLCRLRAEKGTTILLVTNDMTEVAELADAVTVLVEGRTLYEGAPASFFAQKDLVAESGMVPPLASQVVTALAAGGMAVDITAINISQAEETIWQAMMR